MGAGETKTLISQIIKLNQLRNTNARIDPQFMINHTQYLQTLRQALQRVNDGQYQLGGIQFTELSHVAQFIRDYQDSVEQYFNEFIATPNINNKQEKKTFWSKVGQVIAHKKVQKPQQSPQKQQKQEQKQEKKPKKDDNISMLQQSPKVKQIIKKEQLKPVKQQISIQKSPIHGQSKNSLTQVISTFQSLLKTTISTQTHKNITSCIEQLTKLQTKINNVEEGNTGFIFDNNVNQLQNVSAFLMNCWTDIISYHAKYVETASEINRYKNTSSRKGFWTKAIQVITKAKKQADIQDSKGDEWRNLRQENEQIKRRIHQKQSKLNQQQIKALKQLSLDIITGNFKNINGQWFCQNAYAYNKISDYCHKHKLSADILQPFIVEFNKIKKLAEQFNNKQGITPVDNLCTYVSDLQKQCKLYKSLFESVKSDLPDSQTKIIRGCFAEQSYNMYENKISYKDTCKILKVVMDDYQQISQLMSRLAIISGGENVFQNSNIYAMSLRCTRMVDKIQREIKDAVQQLYSQTGLSSVTSTEYSISSILKLIKSYRNFMDTKMTNNKMQANPKLFNNPRIQYNSRRDKQAISEQQQEAIIVSKYLDQILADTKITIVSQIQPYGNKAWTQWMTLFGHTHQSIIKQKSFIYQSDRKLNHNGKQKKQSTELPQIIIVQVLAQLAKAYGLPNHTSICELLDQIAKQELMVEWINNNYKKQSDSQHQSTARTQSMTSLNNKSSSNLISYSGSGICSLQTDGIIFQAAIKTSSNNSTLNNNTNINTDHKNEELNWSPNIKQLQANNTKYLEQLNILRDQNRKLKQTIDKYELNVNTKKNNEQQLLCKIKQLEIRITDKDTQFTNFNNLMLQNMSKQQNQKAKAIQQLNKQITDLNNNVAKHKGEIQTMQSKVIDCLNIIKQQQIITNVSENKRQPIEILFTAITALIQRKNNYKKQKLQLKATIDGLNTQLVDMTNTIEQQQKLQQQHMLIEVQCLKKRKEMQEIEQFVIKAKESSNKLKKKDSECEKLIQKKQQQLSKLNQQIAQKTLRTNELKIQITTIQSKSNEITNLREQLNKLKKQLDTVKLQVNDINQKLIFTQKQYNIKQSSLTQLTIQVEMTDVKLKDMKKQLQGMTKEKQQITIQKVQHKNFIDQASSQKDKLNSEIIKANRQLNELRPVVQREMQTLDGIKELKQVKTEYKMQQSSFINQKPQIKSQQKSVIKLQDRLRQSDMKNQELQNIIHNLKIQTKQTVKKNELLEKECHALNVIISGFSSKFRQKESNHKFKQYFGGIISTVQRQALFKQLVELYEPNKIASIKLIFKHPLMSPDSCTQILEGKSRLVFIVRLVSGMTVAMHSKEAVSGVKRVATGKGFIASLTNCRFFAKRKDIQNAPTAIIKNGVLSFGADEIRLNIEQCYKLEVNVGFGSKNHSFETRENTGNVLTDNRSCEIDSYEIYELILEV